MPIEARLSVRSPSKQAAQATLQVEKEALKAKSPKSDKKKTGLSYKEKKELEALPDQIEA